ncbi:MAG TPA: hypothetical protein VK714_16645 [Myxococcota bacterium]|nr:hypothetical protein [Myxococcota bacterium]
MARKRPKTGVPSAKALGLSLGEAAGLLLAFAALALAVYWPALEGPFVSDDLHYVATNPYVQSLSFDNVRQILDPWGAPGIFVVNYTPVHLLLHAVQWSLFGPSVVGYHVTNVLLHALGSVLLVAVFRASGVQSAAALLGGLLFLLHPVNVEAVAWISQLKTTACFVLSLGALLAFPTSPALATPLFFLALLAKPTASFLLPVAAVVVFVRLWRGKAPVRHLVWLALWTAGFLLLAVAQIEVNRRGGTPDAGLTATGLDRIRTVAAIALRYVVMSASSLGVSAFHEPERSLSATDPWFLASIPVLALVFARSVWSLVRRREEAVYWVWAAASFAPVSQIFPFLYPMADRYLYFILPGFLGASLLALQALFKGRVPRRLSPALRAAAPRVGFALGTALCIVFAVRSHARAEIWRTPALLLADAARNYPDGVSANLLRAKRAVQEGDADRAVAALQAAQARGFNRFEQLENDPSYDPIRGDSRFQAIVREMAAWWIERSYRLQDPTQLDLRMRAVAHLARGEEAEAIRALEAALARGGPIDERIRAELSDLRRSAAAPQADPR